MTPAVDYALTRSDVDGNNLALMGMSMGGYFAARAAAFYARANSSGLVGWKSAQAIERVGFRAFI